MLRRPGGGAPLKLPRSAVSSITWPAIPDAAGALMLAMQHQLQEGEWLQQPAIEELQFEALNRLLHHATRTVPYYRDRQPYTALARSRATAEAWTGLPVLARADVQEAGAALTSDSIPADHQPISEVFSSGSTGLPVRGLGTKVTRLLWLAITLRETLWHQRDLNARLAAIRAAGTDNVPDTGRELTDWGSALKYAYNTGPAALLGVGTDVKVQADWLVRQNPDYLLSLPSNLLALAQHFEESGASLPRLRQVSSYGEMVEPEVRDACRRAWGVDLVDMYSTQELGYLALQCPESELYHVQSESVYVEVVDERGEPCSPGEIGRVVVSTLHNYAMPLFRYDVGDYAEVGETCPCGRGLPVLSRIMGRARNMLRLPDGRQVWPRFGAAKWAHIGQIHQLQLVQRKLDWIEARIVGPRPLSAAEELEFTSVLQDALGYPFRTSFLYLDRLERSAGLKFEAFLSQVERRVGEGMGVA